MATAFYLQQQQHYSLLQKNEMHNEVTSLPFQIWKIGTVINGTGYGTVR